MGTRGKRLPVGMTRPEPSGPRPNGDTNRTLIDIELALARHYNWKRNIIAFNVLGVSGTLPLFHECDMLVVTPSGYLTEIEIKRTYADFSADFKKSHHHESRVPMRDFAFCVPEGIYDKVLGKLAEERVIPTQVITYSEDLTFRTRDILHVINDEYHRKYGIVESDGYEKLVLEDNGEPMIEIVDQSRRNQPLFLEQRLEIARLGAMRQVTLRERLLKQERELRKDPDTALVNKITEQEILLNEYRRALKEATGHKLNEKEILYG